MIELEIVEGALIRKVGVSNAPVLIFFPAFGDTGYCYEKVFRSALSKEYFLAAVDLWGFGASPARADVRSVSDYSRELEKLITKLVPSRSFGLVGHSIAGSIAVQIATRNADKVFGVFSIEGNLTPDDAMFTGKATQFDNPEEFKACFLDEIWSMGHSSEALRHYYSSSRFGDPETMWHLGRDASKISEDNRLGEAFKQLSVPATYYWSRDSTPDVTQEWIARSGIVNSIYDNAGHWPMVEQPEATAQAISGFFKQIRRV